MNNCPWDSFEKGTIEFCEKSLCSWITQPANTWSNLGFLIVGLYIIYRAYKDRYQELAVIGYIEIILFAGSFFFHMSSVFIGEFFDLLGMFMFALYMVCVNLWRTNKFSIPALIKTYSVLLVGGCILLVMIRPIGIALFIVFLVVAFSLEAAFAIKMRSSINYKPLLMLIGTFSLAFFIWVRDFRGIWCDPDNHWLQGHAVWHILNSFCFYFLYRFYQQFLKKNHACH